MFGYFGWLTAQGGRPYLDFWDNKPPGIWWLNAAAFRILGEGIVGELVICGAAVGASLFAFRAAAITTWGRWSAWPAVFIGGLLLTHGRFECGLNRTETFVIAFESIAIACFLQSRVATNRRGWLAIAGFTAGTAPLFKQAGAAAGAACVIGLTMDVWLAARRERQARLTASARDVRQSAIRQSCADIAWFAVAALVPPFTAIVALWNQGALAAAYFAVAEFNRAYFAVHDASWVNLGGATKLFWVTAIVPLSWPLSMIALGAAFSVMILLRGKRAEANPDLSIPEAAATSHSIPNARLTALAASGPGIQPDARNVATLAIWGALAYYLATVGPGRQAYHFAPALPAIGLLALWPMRMLITQNSLRNTLARRPSAAATIVIYFTGYASLVMSTLAAAQLAWEEKPHWYALQRATPTGYERQADVIRQLCPPDETIYVWGWDPGAYRFAYRRVASRFATLEKGSHVGELARFILDGAMHDLREHPPRLFMIAERDWAGLRAGPDADFAKWIGEQYREIAVIDGMIIFIRELDRSADGS